jgi:hypothetical protein
VDFVGENLGGIYLGADFPGFRLQKNCYGEEVAFSGLFAFCWWYLRGCVVVAGVVEVVRRQ